MLNGKVFYFNSTRNLAAAFGDLFNNIHVIRTDKNNAIKKDIVVPLSYAPRQKYIAKLAEDLKTVETTLPRMSFSLDSMKFDSSRMINRLGKTIKKDTSGNLKEIMNPVPYNFEFTLNIWTKNLDDKLQIIEQILPFFSPDFNLSVVMIPELGITEDIQIILESQNLNDEYEGAFSDFRVITAELSFVMKGYLYPPITNANIINKVLTNIKDYNTSNNIETLTTQTNPLNVYKDDSYIIEETIT